MAKNISVTFDFSGEEEVPREFLSGQSISSQQPLKQKSKRGRKSLKAPLSADEEPEVPEDEVLFQKAYYAIREVAEMFKVPVYQLRLWDNEFDMLEPRKNGRGDRLFRPQDIKTLQLIHDLVRRRKFTLEGAKEFLRKNAKARDTYELIASLQKIKGFLLELKANL